MLWTKPPVRQVSYFLFAASITLKGGYNLMWEKLSQTPRVLFAKTPAHREINNIAAANSTPFCYRSWSCFALSGSSSECWYTSFVGGKISFSRILLCVNNSSRWSVDIPRPSLGLFDEVFWVTARRVLSAWKQSLIIVTPETVVCWHRSGFRNLRLAKIKSASEMKDIRGRLCKQVTWATFSRSGVQTRTGPWIE